VADKSSRHSIQFLAQLHNKDLQPSAAGEMLSAAAAEI
jgi:hypothetical protein